MIAVIRDSIQITGQLLPEQVLMPALIFDVICHTMIQLIQMILHTASGKRMVIYRVCYGFPGMLCFLFRHNHIQQGHSTKGANCNE